MSLKTNYKYMQTPLIKGNIDESLDQGIAITFIIVCVMYACMWILSAR